MCVIRFALAFATNQYCKLVSSLSSYLEAVSLEAASCLEAVSPEAASYLVVVCLEVVFLEVASLKAASSLVAACSEAVSPEVASYLETVSPEAVCHAVGVLCQVVSSLDRAGAASLVTTFLEAASSLEAVTLALCPR